MVSNGESSAVEVDYGVPYSSVQEMVRVHPSSVPERFLRSEEDRSKDHVVHSHLSDNIPIIDFSLLSGGHEEELQKFDKACEEWGFFQVINHGIEEVVLQNVKDAGAKFFSLPIEEKKKYPVDMLSRQGYGLASIAREEQKLDWSDTLLFRLHPIQFRKLELWPTSPPELKEVVERYSAEVRRVGEELLGSLSLIMKMDKGALLEQHKEMWQSMRVNYYPTCATPDKVSALGPHSDPGTITLLLQEDGVVGLHIRHSDGWVPVKPIRNSLVVNLGDVVEILSNGKYKSIEHRGVANKTRTRMSFATIIAPHPEVEIEPMEQMVDLQQPNKRYKRVKVGEYMVNVLQRKLERKTQVLSLKDSS